MNNQRPVVTLFSKPDCHLCDIAKARIESARESEAFELEMINIAEDPKLIEKYGERIPVVLLNGEEVFVYRVSEKQLRNKIRGLSQTSSIFGRFRKKGSS
ncbi:MAG TPA: glutaredoxin family protein [Candidatus Latescibacteria bacterium]|nr:thioredoxin family protein [Gemmatimonadota bacterium]HCR18643.1 glutaredoxin family protein [Candidatus Latescibacterota bacterium]